MRLQLSPKEAQRVLDQLDTKPTEDLKHVRARLAEGLATAAKSKMLDPDELHALIWAAGVMQASTAPGLGAQIQAHVEALTTAIPKLEAILRNQRPAGGA